jgi:hypothetical protein
LLNALRGRLSEIGVIAPPGASHAYRLKRWRWATPTTTARLRTPMAIRNRPTVHDDQESRDQDRRALPDYLPVTADSWYNTYIKPFQADIKPALQACAAPGLFADAAIGTDLGAALTELFTLVTQSGHLTH